MQTHGIYLVQGQQNPDFMSKKLMRKTMFAALRSILIQNDYKSFVNLRIACKIVVFDYQKPESL
jgi:hypothetical protein